MSFTDHERRGHVRYDFPARIEYVLHPDVSSGVLKGVTIDLSHSGMSLYVFTPLREGQKITVRSLLPISSRAAMVCWITKVDEGFYKTGMKFI